MKYQTKSLLVKFSVVVLVGLALLYLIDQRDTPAEQGVQLNDEVDGGGGEPRFQVGDAQITITTDPGTPMVGPNILILKVWDADGNPATDVTISAYAEMPAMGAMAAMRASAGQLEETEPGQYEGEVDLSMRGEWPLTVQIEDHPEFGNRRIQFDFATDRPGLSIASGGTLIGAQAAIGGEAVSDATLNESDNTFLIDSRRRQLIGLQTEEATYRDLNKTIRAVGQVAHDERLLSQVTLKYDGFIGDLMADYVGARVEAGQVLFTVYSPDLLAAQQEYLETLKRGASDSLARAARHRLILWDMSEGEIDALEQRGAAQDYIPIYAPHSGVVLERHISDGSGIRAGQALLTIVDLSRVWIEADIYEADLELISVGTSAIVTIPYLPDQRFDTQVEYIYPHLQRETRTARLRMTIDNAVGVLKPDMYADVSLEVALGEQLAVPEEAVIVAGNSRVVFVDLGGGYLKPVNVVTGQRAQGLVEIKKGLEAGDVVVVSGNFLVAAEARLKTGIQQW